MARLLMPAAQAFLDPSQRGFLSGINGHAHTESINKFFYDGVEGDDQRYVFFLDTAKAFDSIDHAWIMAVLDKAEFPLWVRRFVRGSLANVRVTPFFGSLTGQWIPIERGVKEGCPLSPLLFNIAYDPLLYRLRLLASPPVPRPLPSLTVSAQPHPDSSTQGATAPSTSMSAAPIFSFCSEKAAFSGPLQEAACEAIGPTGPCAVSTHAHIPFCLYHVEEVLGLS